MILRDNGGNYVGKWTIHGINIIKINADHERIFMKMISQYRRVEFDSIPIYIQPETPDWFIPTTKADFILRNLKKGGSIPTICPKISLENLVVSFSMH